MTIIDRSMLGGLLIILIAAARTWLKGRIPARMMLILWAAVMLRLFIPARFEAPVLPPSPVQPDFPMAYSVVRPEWSVSPIGGAQQAESIAVEPDHTKMLAGCAVYFGGALTTAAAFLALYLIQRKRIGPLQRLEDETVCGADGRKIFLYESPSVSSPVSMGVIRRRIVFPAGVRPGGAGADLMLEHELAHLNGYHGLIKGAALAAVCMHWFNPLVWLMRALLSRDLELIADEAALRNASGRREEYAYLLIRMAAGGRNGAAMEFGGNRIKERIVCMMKKRNSIWAALLALALISMSVCAFAEPVERPQREETPDGLYALDGGIAATMTKEEFRKWYLLRAELAHAAGEINDEDVQALREEILDDLLGQIAGDTVQMRSFIRHEDGVFVGEVNLILCTDGVWRVVTASSFPMNESVGLPVNALGDDFAILDRQAETVIEAEIHGLKARGGVLMEKLPPFSTRADAQTAGVVFVEQLAAHAENGQSEVWQADAGSVEYRLDGYRMESALLQYAGEKLISVSLSMTDAGAAQALLSSLTQELGTPQESSLHGGTDETRMYSWEYEAEEAVIRASLAIRVNPKGETVNTSVQMGWMEK